MFMFEWTCSGEDNINNPSTLNIVLVSSHVDRQCLVDEGCLLPYCLYTHCTYQMHIILPNEIRLFHKHICHSSILATNSLFIIPQTRKSVHPVWLTLWNVVSWPSYWMAVPHCYSQMKALSETKWWIILDLDHETTVWGRIVP